MSRQFYGKSLKNLFVSALAVLVLFVVTSCNNVIELGNGSLSVALPGGRSVSGASYTIELTGSNGSTYSKTAAAGQVVQFDGLYPDTYSIEVEGLDENNAVVLYGTSDATVKARESAVASVELMEVVTTFDNLTTAIREDGIVYIGSDIEISSSLEVSSNVKIRAAHKDVVLSSTLSPMFNVKGGGDLTLGGGKHLLTLDGENKRAIGVSVKSGKASLIENGRIINHQVSNVHIDDGTFELVGGTITRTIESSGRGVHINTGIFNMRSGAIVGHTSTNNGAGVYISDGGTLNMTGGTISGNKVTSDDGKGHGIYHKGTTFKMSGRAMVDTNNEVYLDGTSITFGSFEGSHLIARITPNDYKNYHEGSGSLQVLKKEDSGHTLTEDVTRRFTITKTEDGGTYTILTTGRLSLYPKDSNPN